MQQIALPIIDAKFEPRSRHSLAQFQSRSAYEPYFKPIEADLLTYPQWLTTTN